MRADTIRPESTYIILFLTRHNESINHDKNDDLYTSSPILTTGRLGMDSNKRLDYITCSLKLLQVHVL